MKKKIKLLIMINILILIVLEIPSIARYYESATKIKGKAIIAEPIIKVEMLQDTIITDFNKKTKVPEYYFIIKNYEIDANNNKRINEIDFICNIEIKNSEDNFPIRYELYDCETNEEMLEGNKISKEIFISKDVELEKKYKLQVYWKDVQNMSNNNDIEIIINVTQKK